MTATSARGEFRWLFGWLRPYRWLLLVLGVLFILASGLSLVYPLILRFLIDHVFTTSGGRYLLPALAILLALSLAQIAITQISRYRYTRMAGRIVLDLRIALFRHLERLPLDFHAGRRAGDIASRVGGDIGEVQSAATGTVLSLATASLTLLATVAVLLYLDPVLFLVTLLPLPLSLWVARRYAPPIRAASRTIREENANLASTLFDSLLGQHFIRSHALEVSAARRFFRDGRGIFASVMRLTRLTCFSAASNGFITALSALVVLGYGGYRVIRGEMTLGSLMAFQIYVSRLHGPLQNLVSLYLRLQQSRVSIRRIMEIFSIPTIARGGQRSARTIRGEIRFDRVSFGYAPDRPILRDVSFAVVPGECVAFVGESGIGKSTLLDLAIGLREPDRGTVLIDGLPVSAYRPASLRRRVGVVSQDVFLFNATIRHNLLIVEPNATEAQIREALTMAGLGEWLDTLPDGLETEVGERALRLSAGQRQRLALARAVLRRPRVLVLDEATSSLDEVTDQQIRAALAPLFRQATTLMASHRQSVIGGADRALLLRDGAILESVSP